ncbi:MAG TPA: alpha/beta fold hydrolase [Thermoanaerobaculia bacterium]
MILRRASLVAVAALVVLGVAFYFRPLEFVHVYNLVQLWRADVHRHDVRVGPYRVEYLEGGRGAPLILIHGVASKAEDATLLMPALTRDHHVFAPDLLGYGGSDKPDVDYSIALQTDVVRGFMDSLRLRQADLLGVSMGGWIALKLAAEHPERVRRLVLVSSAGFAFPTTLRETSFSPANPDELRRILLMQTDRASQLPDFVARDFLRVSREHAWIVRRSMHAMLTQRDIIEGKLQNVRMPVMIVWGTADRVVPFGIAARMQREIPQARVVPLAGCGHLAILECRDRALPAITRFLQ